MKARLVKFATAIHRLEARLLVGLLLVMILTPLAQILLRNVWGTGILWGDSLVRFGVLWLTLIGAMLASRADQHISIDLVQRHLPAEWQRRVRVLIKLFTAAVCFLAAYYCLQFVQMEYADGNLAFGQIPLWLVEAIMPFAFAAMGVRYVLQAAGIGPQGTPS